MSYEPWPVRLEQAESVVARYFSAATNALRRAQESSDGNAIYTEKLTALIMALAGFEAFLNCYFRMIAEFSDPIKKKEIVKITNRKNCPLRKKAESLPKILFENTPGYNEAKIRKLVKDISRYINTRNHFMHLKHDYKGFSYQNVSIEGVLDTSVMRERRFEEMPRSLAAIRRYMKCVFRLHELKDIRLHLDRWTKPLPEWRPPLTYTSHGRTF